VGSGTVKRFNDDNGVSFVTRDDGGPDVFCHHSTIAGDGLKGGA